MKKQCYLLLTVLMLTLFMAVSASADAYVEQYLNETYVEYDIRVAAPDGGVNFRYGPGVEYPKILPDMIPNGVALHVIRQAMAVNGNYWGFVEYAGYFGWVALSQCETISGQNAQYRFEEHIEHANMYVQVNADDVNLRTGAGVEYQKLMDLPLPKGTKLHVYFKAKAANGNDWGFISYQHINGWIALKQCKELKEKEEQGAVFYRIKVAAPDGGVNLRLGPGMEYGRLLPYLIPNDMLLEISEEKISTTGNYWGLTTYEEITGYVTLNQVMPVAEDVSGLLF